MEQKPKSDINKGPKLCCRFAKMMVYNPNIDLVNDNVYREFGLIPCIRSQDIEKKIALLLRTSSRHYLFLQ